MASSELTDEEVWDIARPLWLRWHDQHVYDGGTTWEAFRDGYRAALAAPKEGG